MRCQLQPTDEGYNAFEADVILEVATVDTFDEEEVALATGVAPRSRSSIEALPSQDIDDGDSSNECTICLNVMQLRDG